MYPTLEAICHAQGGIFLRRQAAAAGYTPRELDVLTSARHGPWTRIRYGVYAESAFWSGLTPRERRLLLDSAALLVCDSGTVLSHSSAALRLAYDLLDDDDGLTHVIRLREHERRVTRVQSGIKHHCGRLDPSDCCEVDGLRVTSPSRTVLDVAAEFGYESGLVCADSALRSGMSLDDLVAELAARSWDRSLPTLQRVVGDVDGRAESALETIARIRLRGFGIGDLTPQFEIGLPGGGVARTDLYSRLLHHVFECDGRLKYRTESGQPSEEVLWREKRREDLIRGLGFGFSRLTWADVMPDARSRLRARLTHEIAAQSGGRLTPRLAAG